MSTDLVSLAIEAAGGPALWQNLQELTIDISIGGPIWSVKGWPPDTTFHQSLTVDTRTQHATFTPFTRPDRHLEFDGDTDTVILRTPGGDPADVLTHARQGFTPMLRNSAWDATHLGYFLGYACWNYFTTPFLFTRPDVVSWELSPWREAGQTWRRLAVEFPPAIATHSRRQVFYFDVDGLQRRMDYVTEVNGSTLVGHYSSRHRQFDGLTVATRRRVFRRNPDDTVNLNMPSITLDVHHVDLVHREQRS